MTEIKKPVFVHVPKTAGNSILHSCPWIDYNGHSTYHQALDIFGPDRLYFSVVRHPVDRYISCMALVYSHLQKKDPAQHFYSEILYWLSTINFKHFLEMVAIMMTDRCIDKVMTDNQKLMFRSQSEQLKDIPYIIFFEHKYVGLQALACKVNALFHYTHLQHLGKIEIAKPELSDQAIKSIEEYYYEDMCRYGYTSKLKGE